MNEIEQLRADLATVQKAAQIAKKQGFHERTGNYDQVEGELRQMIVKMETRQAQTDEWLEVNAYIKAEKNREKLAELTTILNAIPPACGLARELVERRIEGIKREMQNNG